MSEKRTTLSKVCKEFQVQDVYELSHIFLEYDQQAIKNETFNGYDSSTTLNKIKNCLLLLDLEAMDSEERKTVQNMLWLWFHHATTVAIWKEKNIPRARELCQIALQYLFPEHPNKITPMIWMLLSKDIEGAKKWNETEVGPHEKKYAEHLLDEYKKGVFKN